MPPQFVVHRCHTIINPGQLYRIGDNIVKFHEPDTGQTTSTGGYLGCLNIGTMQKDTNRFRILTITDEATNPRPHVYQDPGHHHDDIKTHLNNGHLESGHPNLTSNPRDNINAFKNQQLTQKDATQEPRQENNRVLTAYNAASANSPHNNKQELEMRYEKTKFERISESYQIYEDLHQEHGEETRDFIKRFRKAYSDLEEAGIPLSPYLRTFDLLRKSNLKTKDRHRILTIYDDAGRDSEAFYERVTYHLRMRM